MPRALIHEPETRMTREDYRAWAEQQPSHRFDRIEGVVVAMAPETVAHNRRKTAAWAALRAAVRTAGLPCEVLASGITVEVNDSDYEPDAVLQCGASRLPDDAMAVPDPLVVVEVLSAASSAIDRSLKRRDYFRLPSVRHYLIVWPATPRIVHHARRPNGDVATRVLNAGHIVLDPPGITVAFDDFYAD
jgi:Uma2 family endonuclease